ncbi:MAG: HD domain-containing protein [Betaproteobacteria bacterium]|nr:HD domain-containing protein [Betaproteobacteria bacterium]
MKAASIAEYAHEAQFRKGSNMPYIIHPTAVAKIVSQYSDNENAVAAAYLHDVLEDVPSDKYSEAQMAIDFGKRIVEIVKAVSENKRAGEQEKPWAKRKQYYIEHLIALKDADALLVSAADKIHNLSSMLSDYKNKGDKLWGIFNAPKEKQLAYYKALNAIFQNKNIPQEMKHDFNQKVEQLEIIITGKNSAIRI